MPRRGENIRKRKDNRWEGRYIAGYNESGKAKYVSVYAKTYLEVKKKLSEAQTETRKALPTPKEKISFREVLFLWLEAGKENYKEQTYARYRYIIETHIVPNIGVIPVAQISTEYINSFITDKRTKGRIDGKGGLSVSYTQTISFIILSALNYAVQENLCSPIIGKTVKLSKSKRNLDVLSLQEQRQLENYLLADIDIRKAGILLAIYTGVRLGELCGLCWNDIDLNNGIIHINRTIERICNHEHISGEPKTKLIISETKTISSNRFIPISRKTILLLKLIKHNDSPFVLPGISRDFMDPRTLQYAFKRFLNESHLRNAKFHVLRHTFATRCMESGMDMKTLSEILGHSDTNITTNIYVHSTIEHKRKTIETMSSYCGQK